MAAHIQVTKEESKVSLKAKIQRAVDKESSNTLGASPSNNFDSKNQNYED